MRQNWAGNYTYLAAELRRPGSLEEAQAIVAASRHLSVLGSRHSFNGIADTSGVQLDLSALPRQIEIDGPRREVTVDGGILYGDLAPVLHAEGFALANLASLPHISVAGAVSTATHGSGSAIGNLATAVTGLDLIGPDGEITRLTRQDDPGAFAGAIVGLGALGPLARLTLRIEPTYEVRQDVFADLPFDRLTAEFDDIFAAATSVSVFTDWRGEAAGAVWLKDRGGAARAEFHGARPATDPMHPLPDGRAEDCTVQMGVRGPWHERLPHFRMEFTPSNGAEIQAEYFLPRPAAAEGIAVLRHHGERLAPVLMISEIRTVAGDDLWLSPGYRGDYVAFHFTFRRDWPALEALLPGMEADLIPLGALPHWGKVTTMDPEVIRAGYDRMDDFRALARARDPEGKFRNALVDRLIFDGA